MQLPNSVGVANPFALIETLHRRRIAWDRVDNAESLLEKSFGVPIGTLLSGDDNSPLYAFRPKPTRNIETSFPLGLRGEAAREKFDALIRGNKMSIDPSLVDRWRDILVLADPTREETEYPNASWQDIGDFFEEAAEFADPVQGGLADCWLIAALASVAWTRPYAIMQRTRATGAGDQQFVDAITLNTGANPAPVFEVSEAIPVWNGSDLPLFGRSSEPGEIWPCLYEKAFAKLRSGNLTDKPDFHADDYGDCVDACVKLVPGLTAQYIGTSNTSADDLWATLQSNSIANPATPGIPSLFRNRAGRTFNPLTAWTYGKDTDSPDGIRYDGTTRVVGNHCYSVLGWITVSVPSVSLRPQLRFVRERYIVLRNPWATWEATIDVLAGNWDAQDQTWLRTTPLNMAGVFAMKIETFKKYYAGLGVAS